MDTIGVPSLPPDSVIFGKSSLMLELEAKVRRVLGTNLSVLLQGERGTGKATLSKLIHKHSKGAAGSYIRVHCTDNTDTLWDSLKPIFVANRLPTNRAISDSGLDSSSIGTLFLKDLGELSPKNQSQLFHLLPDEQDHRGSEGQPNPWTKGRIVSATARNLRQEVNENRFRRDLFYRLAVVTLEVPPLRKRMDDLLVIAHYFLEQYSESFGLPRRPFPDTLVERMHRYRWPGNIRELENFICRYVILGSEEPILRELSPNKQTAVIAGTASPGGTLLKDVTRQALANVEREMILKALEQHQGKLKRAAQSLGISYRTLINKMDQMGLPRVRHAPRSRDR
jgi:two-component system, NtrC family, response regulator AtoC